MTSTSTADTATYPDLAGKTAVVTGGSRGIGAATARALARNGVSVAVVGRDRTAIDDVVASIEQGGGSAIAAAADCTAAKSGIVSMSRHLAKELAPQGVRVNCLSPATVENDRMREFMTDEQRHRLGAQFPLGRLGRPADVAAAALFLASQSSSWITGITLDIAGGAIMP